MVGFQLGDRIGRWTIISGPQRMEFRSARPWGFHVRCECGTERLLGKGNLSSGRSLSCGCWRPAILSEQRRIHGGSRTRLHNIWKAMKRRCLLPTDSVYANYGGRGVTLALEWHEFVPFRDWAESNGYTDELTIDRIDGTKGYEPENCRWATYQEQANNLRSNRILEAFGERKTLAMWGRDPRCVVTINTIKSRVARGWDTEAAITGPRYVHVNPPRPYRTKRRIAAGLV